MESQFSDEVILASSVLLLSVADADEILEDDEIETIQDILSEFYSVELRKIENLMVKGKELLRHPTGIFNAGQVLNKNLELPDKIEFVKCVFEVGYSDGELHYMEHHTIKKIANILNIEQSDLIAAHVEVKDWFN